jgi:hypothetical protein
LRNLSRIIEDQNIVDAELNEVINSFNLSIKRRVQYINILTPIETIYSCFEAILTHLTFIGAKNITSRFYDNHRHQLFCPSYNEYQKEKSAYLKEGAISEWGALDKIILIYAIIYEDQAMFDQYKNEQSVLVVRANYDSLAKELNNIINNTQEKRREFTRDIYDGYFKRLHDYIITMLEEMKIDINSKTGRFSQANSSTPTTQKRIKNTSYIIIKNTFLDESNYLLMINNGEKTIRFNAKKKSATRKEETKAFIILRHLWESRWEIKNGKQKMTDHNTPSVLIANLTRLSGCPNDEATRKHIIRLNNRFKKEKVPIKIEKENTHCKIMVYILSH